MDRLIAKGISRLANAGRTLGVAFNRRPTDDELRKIHDLLRDPDTLSQEAVRDEALEALEEGYAVLADIKNQWEGRHRLAGQRLLCKMRDAIAKATGRSAEDVQDNPIALKREPNAAGEHKGWVRPEPDEYMPAQDAPMIIGDFVWKCRAPASKVSSNIVREWWKLYLPPLPLPPGASDD